VIGMPDYNYLFQILVAFTFYYRQKMQKNAWRLLNSNEEQQPHSRPPFRVWGLLNVNKNYLGTHELVLM